MHTQKNEQMEMIVKWFVQSNSVHMHGECVEVCTFLARAPS